MTTPAPIVSANGPTRSVELPDSLALNSQGTIVRTVSLRWALFVSVASLLLPWRVRRWVMRTFCGYVIARDARIGLSIIACPALHLGSAARIGHFNVIKGMRVELGECATIGDLNWIAALPSGHPRHFDNETTRDPALILERHAALTSRHFVDCSNRVHIGEFSTIAGVHSQILTHAIDLGRNLQVSAPARIGRYCFVGTGCVILKGAQLPDRSILAAHSSLVRDHTESLMLYSGVPASPVKKLDADMAYFHRVHGFVD